MSHLCPRWAAPRAAGVPIASGPVSYSSPLCRTLYSPCRRTRKPAFEPTFKGYGSARRFSARWVLHATRGQGQAYHSPSGAAGGVQPFAGLRSCLLTLAPPSAPCGTVPSLLEGEQRCSDAIEPPRDEDLLSSSQPPVICVVPCWLARGRVIECLRVTRGRLAPCCAAPEAFHTTPGRGRAPHRS
jgi:hypothetical protein